MSLGSTARLAICTLGLLPCIPLACSDALLSNGADCTARAQCQSGLCYANLCLDPAADDDSDGLDNRTEHRLGSHPRLKDSDGDGKPDGNEIGSDPKQPLDHDGDGKPDVVESAAADADRDCIPDERDVQDDVPASDEGLVAMQACATLGVCAAAKTAILAQCDHGVLQCNYAGVPGWSATEACDGKDDDCDGLTDEGHTYGGSGVGQPCTGTGQCGQGTVECQAGAAQCSSNPGGSQSQAQAETCNGKDDDCDGQTDESFARDGFGVGKPCLGKGECGVGVVVCGGLGAALCSTEPGGPQARNQPESCNGKDDDCNGLTDDGLHWQGLPVGATCTALGACGQGVVVCGSKGDAVCSTAAGAPQSKAKPETCNGQDDDCDGQTDEGLQFQGLVLGQPCSGKGACGAGVVVCGKAGAATCSTLPDGPNSQAVPEVCNGKDDDCDGQIDDQVAWQGKPLGAVCTGFGTCGAGVVECAKDGQATCSSNGNGSASQAKPEACNGKDDDCDGQTDEGVPAPVLQCQAPGVCAAVKAKVACVQGTWACDFAGAPGWEALEVTCDGKDNDCDGQTDEGLLSAWGILEPSAWNRPAARLHAAYAAGDGSLWAAGGLAAGMDGTLVSPPGELWRFDPAMGTWLRIAQGPALARTHAALAYLPPGLMTTEPLLLMAGGDAAGAIAIGVATGKVESVSSNTVDIGNDGALVASGDTIWAIATKGALPTVRRWTKETSWTFVAPQLPLTAEQKPASAALCARSDGTVFAVGMPLAEAAWFASLASGTEKWQMLDVPPIANAGVVRLVCASAKEPVWLVGATGVGKSAAKKILHWDSGGWNQPAAMGAPEWTAPAVATFQDKLLIALGESGGGTGQPDAWVGLPGAWTRIDAVPESAAGARWIAGSGEVFRAGGAWVVPGPVTSTAQFQAPAWRLKSGKWTRWPLPPEMPSRAFAAWALEPKGNGLILWSGLTKASDPVALLSQDVHEGAVGAVRLDLQTGAWTAVEGPVANALPPTKADPAVTPGNVQGTAYLLGAGSQPGTAELWYLDLAKPQSTLLWQSSVSQGPSFRPSSSLALDPGYNRLTFAQIANGQLELWAWSLAGGAWQKLAAEPTQGYRALLAGGGELPDLLLLAIPPPGKPGVSVRRVFLGAQPKWELVAPPKDGWPAWQGPLQALWKPGKAEAWLGGAQIGPQQPAGVMKWPRVCP
jgi:hypothetical protein